MTMSATLSRHPPGARNDRALAMAAFQIESRSWGGLVQPLSSQAKRVLCRDAIGLCLAWGWMKAAKAIFSGRFASLEFT